MSRMRLMEAMGAGTGMLVSVCLNCGAERESRPPYEVMHCDCRSSRDMRAPVRKRRRPAARAVSLAA